MAASFVRIVVLALVAACAVAPPAGAGQSITTPGYKGTTKVPKTRGGTTTAKPRPVALGAGQDPAVIVDAAGTAHIAWNEGTTLHYCRFRRGAQACEAQQSWPQKTLSWAPVVVAHGDQVLILREDGQDAGGPVRAFVSD